MEAKGFGGSVAGIPVRGGIVSINSADAATIITAVSGLIMTTAKVAMVGGLALGLFALLFKGLEANVSSKVPILSLARIKNLKRNFLGICINETIECLTGGQILKIPTFTINKIKTLYCGLLNQSAETFYGYSISLIDGSSYSRCIPITKQLNFLTISGEQRTDFFCKEIVTQSFWQKKIELWTPHIPNNDFNEVDLTISGVTIGDLADLRQRLAFAFENNLDKIIETIGKERFENYFVFKG